MGIVTSMFLIAAGAIMRFAVTVQGHGFDVQTTGVVLMIVGAVGAVLSIAFWASWGGFGHYRRGAVQRTVVTSPGPPVQTVQQTQREVI
ncbi:MAG: hypothetical protein M0008_00690 [Actinomycetota bacterium]|jgi:hypothetical protein|nr:hypothetical protein [Actinomycetota bacterium]